MAECAGNGGAGATGLIETYFVAKLGTDALAGMALVFPCVMLMQMISAGAMGGGISSAIARALGAGRREEADALVLHAVVINVALGAFFSVIMLAFGAPIYRALGGQGGELKAALIYSNVVFAGNVLVWLMNGLANVIRGTGNMLMPALVIVIGVVFLIPLSPCLIFGIGPFPALGIAGGGVAVVLFNAAGAAVLGWYVLSGRNLARLRLSRLRWPLFRNILNVGAVASITSVQTNVIIASATALVASAAGASAVAGYGTGARLEYLVDSADLRPRRAAGSAGWHQYRRGQSRARVTYRLRRRRHRLRPHRDDRHCHGAVAARLARPVQRRPAGNRERRGLSARGRSVLWLLRSRPCALFRLARRRPAILAADSRFLAYGGRYWRWLAGAAADRLAQLAVRSPSARHGAAWSDGARGNRLRRLVPQAPIAKRCPPGAARWCASYTWPESARVNLWLQFHVIGSAGGSNLVLALALGDECTQRRQRDALAVSHHQRRLAKLSVSRAECARKSYHVAWVILELEYAGSGHSPSATPPQPSGSIFVERQFPR